MSYILIKLIELYQLFFSFDKGALRILAPTGACRFEERCSDYMKRQIQKKGVVEGVILGAKRIISCR